jgi:CRP-like cAMP-binding protein
VEKYLPILRLTGIFNSFSNQELIRLFRTADYTILQYKKGGIIHFESEKCASWDIILKGEVVIQKIDEKGNVLTITEFSVGNTIGGNLLFSRHPYYPMSVLAKSDAQILHINKKMVLTLCQRNQDFLLQFLTSISDKTAILTNKLKSISIKSIRESLIEFLNYEHYSQKSMKIKLQLTKKELAERLGVQRTSLSRELNKMKKEGLVDYDARSITILDPKIIRKG